MARGDAAVADGERERVVGHAYADVCPASGDVVGADADVDADAAADAAVHASAVVDRAFAVVVGHASVDDFDDGDAGGSPRPPLVPDHRHHPVTSSYHAYYCDSYLFQQSQEVTLIQHLSPCRYSYPTYSCVNKHPLGLHLPCGHLMILPLSFLPQRAEKPYCTLHHSIQANLRQDIPSIEVSSDKTEDLSNLASSHTVSSHLCIPVASQDPYDCC